MSAEVLREAAALIRERVKAAPDQTVTDKRVTGVWLNSAYYLTTRPVVALAVADWLDAESQAHIHRPAGAGDPINLYDMPGVGDNTPAMRVARAYLGDGR